MDKTIPPAPVTDEERARLQRLDDKLEEGLRETFPASDPPSALRREDDAAD